MENALFKENDNDFVNVTIEYREDPQEIAKVYLKNSTLAVLTQLIYLFVFIEKNKNKQTLI